MEKRINALETELKQKTEQLDCKTKEFNKQQECLKQLQEQLNHEDLDARRQIDAYSLRLCNIFQINGNPCFMCYLYLAVGLFDNCLNFRRCFPSQTVRTRRRRIS